MADLSILEGKKILIVDDEKDVLDTLSDLLDMGRIDSAQNFEDAKKLLNQSSYDIAIFDIMGVLGYDLLKIATQKGIPALMFTAHALTPNDLFKSIDRGAKAYIPKEKMSDIALYVAELLEEHYEGISKPTKWFARLKSFFDNKFGTEWIEQRKVFTDKSELLDKYDWLSPPDI